MNRKKKGGTEGAKRSGLPCRMMDGSQVVAAGFVAQRQLSGVAMLPKEKNQRRRRRPGDQ